MHFGTSKRRYLCIIKNTNIGKIFSCKNYTIMLILLYFFVNILIEKLIYSEYNKCIKYKEKFI